ncbi:hypothetical protein ACFU96_42065 [Streptomyces sp. NPDC057620]|uniref:hypothetical protein n=1 Tax=Streptomyces sp. NPDC057620 TaxID=3346185 RepID=UPI00367DEAEE
MDLAAVVGREFTAADVAALAERDHDGVPADVLAGASADGDAVPSLRGGVEAALVRLRGHRLVDTADVPDAPDGSGRETPVLRFSSGLLHEVTYHSMAKRARAERHEHLAAQLAARSPDAVVSGEDRTEGRATQDRTVEAGAAMAGHLEHAHRYRAELGITGPRTEALRRAAAHCLVESGTRALARSDLAWADGLLRRALALARDGEPDRIAATRGLGEVCLATGRTDEGCSLLRDVLTALAPHTVETAHAVESAYTVETAHARLALSVVSADLAGGTPGEVAQRTMEVFERAGDELGQARAAVRLAQERQFEGRHEAADLLLSRGLEHARRSGAEPERALALGAMGISLWRGPEPVPGATARAWKLLAEHGEQRPTVRLTLNCPLAVLYALGERWQDAHTCLTRVRRLVDGLGYAEGAVVLPLFHATVEALAGDERHALDLLDEGIAAAHALRADGLLAALHRESARLLLDAGRVDEAVARLTATTGPEGPDGPDGSDGSDGPDSPDSPGGPGGLDGPGAASPAPASPARSDAADLDGLLARIAVAEGRPADAVALSERAVRHAVGTDSPVVRAIAWLDRSEVVRRTGRAAQARAAAERAVACFESKGHLPGARRAAAARAALDTAPARTGGGSRPGTAPLPDRTPKGP